MTKTTRIICAGTSGILGVLTLYGVARGLAQWLPRTSFPQVSWMDFLGCCLFAYLFAMGALGVASMAGLIRNRPWANTTLRTLSAVMVPLIIVGSQPIFRGAFPTERRVQTFLGVVVSIVCAAYWWQSSRRRVSTAEPAS